MVLAPKHKRPNTSIHHKKRYGQHRKQTKPYLQTYWPYLPIALIIGFGLLVNHLWSTNQISFLGNTASVSTNLLLSDTNKERTAAHEQLLELNKQLAVAAQSQASDMATANYWSTTTPSGQQPGVFIKQAGYSYKNASENLAYGFTSSNDILVSWMSSPDHKANILNAHYQDVGFGIAHATNYQGMGFQTIIVAIYGQAANGAAVNLNPSYSLSPTTAVVSSTASPHFLSQHVARIQLITDSNASWSVVLLLSIVIGGLSLLIIRHSLFWRKALSRSEVFVVQHPWVDMLLVTVVMTAFILSRSAGNIL